jgi:hypothetical protein
MKHMRLWVGGGPLPPVQSRIEFAGDPPGVVRDRDGIARGGIRLPQVEVPIACNSSVPCDEQTHNLLTGSCRPFAPEEIRARYGDRVGYLARFEREALVARDAGVILLRDVAPLLAEAAADFPPLD